MRQFSWLQRYRIRRRAKEILGQKIKQDQGDFMDQCVEALVADGTASDEDQAQEVCQLLWDEQGDDMEQF